MFLNICLAIALLIVFLQDVKYRHIHILLPLIILVISFYIFKKNIDVNYLIILQNILFVFLTLLLLVMYMSLKNKSFLNPFKNYFGLGDLFFFVSITPLFVTYNYVLFFIFSMLFSVVIHLIFSKLMTIKTVPLAGFSALFLIFILLKDLLFDFKSLTLIL